MITNLVLTPEQLAASAARKAAYDLTLAGRLYNVVWPGIDTSAPTDSYERDWTDEVEGRKLSAVIEFIEHVGLQEQCLAFVEALAAKESRDYDARQLADEAAHAALKPSCITTLPCYCTEKCWLTTDHPEAQRRRDAIINGTIVFP